MWSNRYDKSSVHISADPVVVPNYISKGLDQLKEHTSEVDVDAVKAHLQDGSPNLALIALRAIPPAGAAGICAGGLMRSIIGEMNSGRFG